jgi:hypothetical protein
MMSGEPWTLPDFEVRMRRLTIRVSHLLQGNAEEARQTDHSCNFLSVVLTVWGRRISFTASHDRSCHRPHKSVEDGIHQDCPFLDERPAKWVIWIRQRWLRHEKDM